MNNMTPIRNIAGSSKSALTFDAAAQMYNAQMPVEPGKFFDQSYRVRDSSGNFKTYDSTGAFLVGELERLDQTLNLPLVDVSWPRDIELREDVGIGDDVSSFTLSSFSTASGLGATAVNAGSGIAWAGKKTNQIPGVEIDIQKITYPLTPWALDNSYTIFELESAARLGRPIDTQKFEMLKLQHNMNVDQMIYVGDASIGAYGLLNNPLVSSGGGTVTTVPNGAAGFPTFVKKTADEILLDFSNLLSAAWAASAWAVIPTKVLLPPAQYAYLATQKVSSAGNMSILNYVFENNILAKRNGQELDIQPCKWLQGAGSGATYSGLAAAWGNGGLDRMVIYTPRKEFVRYPMTMMQRTPTQFHKLEHSTTYFAKLGQVEMVYPELFLYADGI